MHQAEASWNKIQWRRAQQSAAPSELDVLPVHDLGVRKGFQFAYGKRKVPAPEQLACYGVRWAPHRTAVAWYLWRAAEFLDGKGW